MVTRTPRVTPEAEERAGLQATPAKSKEEILAEIQKHGYTDEDPEENVEQYRTFKPSEIANYTGVLYVRNLSDTQVCFDLRKTNGEHVVLRLGRNLSPDHPAYRFHRGDSPVDILEPEVARNPGFRRFWAKGKVEVTNDPRVQDELDERYELELEDEIEFQAAAHARLNESSNLRKTAIGPAIEIPMPPNAPDAWKPGK